MENLGTNTSIHVISKILIERLWYSYKKWSSRPIKLDRKLVKLKKILFSVKLLKLIHKTSLLVNIDESVISYNTKSNYSWSRKGVPSNISNGILKGSIGIVSAIMSDGVSIFCVKKGIINSSSIIEFLQILLKIWERI